MDSTTKQGAVALNRRLQQAAKEVRMLLHHRHVARLLCTSSNSDLKKVECGLKLEEHSLRLFDDRDGNGPGYSTGARGSARFTKQARLRLFARLESKKKPTNNNRPRLESHISDMGQARLNQILAWLGPFPPYS
ncbi:hypothetical protein PIB30_025619 [Stylosanthes scabra]|uniref:Uncharacterized protein n=1 Tax=Stylosanthes scabra TaxID=79078 RepID=A0ABU6TAU1_9FABA|nr:hypothetical protein [Stylosanthes scabra]